MQGFWSQYRFSSFHELGRATAATSGISQPCSNSRDVASCRRLWKHRSSILSALQARVNDVPADFEL